MSILIKDLNYSTVVKILSFKEQRNSLTRVQITPRAKLMNM